MKRIIPFLLVAFALAACQDQGPPRPTDDPQFAKKKPCEPWPECKSGGDGGGQYTVLDLGTLTGGKNSSSVASDISEKVEGDVFVVGSSRSDPDAPHVATLWTVSGGAAIGDPLELGGYTESHAYGIKNDGTIAVGTAGSGESSTPVWWDGSDNWSHHMLPTLAEGGTYGEASAVNYDRQIVGWSEATDVQYFAATLWTRDGDAYSATPLHDASWDGSRAYDITEDGGIAVGNKTIRDPADGTRWVNYAVLWKIDIDGTTSPCNLHEWDPSYGRISSAFAVSENTDGNVRIAGYMGMPSGVLVAVVWEMNPGDCSSVAETELARSAYAADVNAVQPVSGGSPVWEVVGQDRSTGPGEPVLWRFDNGTVEQLELRSVKGDQGGALGVNGAGQIVGLTKAGKAEHAVLWTRNP
jgi:hypothetical protein